MVSDLTTTQIYAGNTKTLFALPSDYRFRLPLPPWATSDMVVTFWPYPGGPERVVTPTEIYTDSDFLWVKPLDITDWSSALLTAYKITVHRRSAMDQLWGPSATDRVNLPAQATNSDKIVRMIQQVAARAFNALGWHPQELAAMTGQEVPLSKRTIPLLADRKGKVLGFDGNGDVTTVALTTPPIMSITPPFAVLSVNELGVISDYSTAQTSVKIQEGTLDTTSEWTLTLFPSSGVTVSGAGTTAQVTNMTSDTGYVDIQANRGTEQLTQRFGLVTSRKGATGSSAPVVQISGPQVFSFPKGQTVPSPSTPKTITATTYNFTPASWGWKYYNGTSWTTLTDDAHVSGSTTGALTVAYDATQWGTSLQLRLQVTASDSTHIAQDEFTIYQVFDGNDGYTVLLTNESHVVACDSSGTPKTGELGAGSHSLTQVRVYKGATLLSAVTGTPTIGQFKLSLSILTSCTASLPAADTLEIDTVSALSGSAQISVNVEGVQTTTKLFTWTKGLDGATGVGGLNGANTAIVLLYQRAASAPVVTDIADPVTWTFASSTITSGSLGAWTLTIPSGTNPIYVIAATAYGSGATDTISRAEWSTPQVLAQNGAAGSNGTNGTNGLNSAVVFLYQRASTSPSVPASTLTYTFSTAALTGTLGSWTTTVPATNGQPLWVTTSAAISSSATASILTGAWSTPTAMAQDGSSAPLLFLSATGQAITFDGTGALSPSSQTITFTANLQNVSGTATFAATAYNSSGTNLGAITLGGSTNVRTLTGALFTTYGSTAYVTIVATLGALTDTMTVYRLQAGAAGTNGTNGASAVAAVLTNDSQALLADNSGNVLSYANSGTDIHVFEGGTELTYDGAGTTAGKYTLTSAGTNITPGSVSLSGIFARVAVGSGVAAGTDTSSMTFTISGKTSLGTSFSITKLQTFSKAKAGAAGSNGTNGSAAVVYDIVPTVFSMNLNISLVYSPTAVTFNTYSTTGGAAPIAYAGRMKIYESTDNVAWTLKYTSSADESTKAYTPSATNLKGIKCELYQAGGTTTLLDWQTVIVTSDGATGSAGQNAITGFLTNEAATFSADSFGNVASFTPANGNFKVFNGITDVTASTTFSFVTSTGCTAAIDSFGNITVSAMSANTATSTFQAVYGGVTIQKILTLSKSLQGSSGTYPSDTSLALRLPLDDMPAYPNNPAGIAYQNDAFTSTTGWIAERGTMSVVSGALRVTSNSTGTSDLLLSSALALGLVVVRIRASKVGTYTLVQNNGTSWFSSGPYTIGTGWTTIAAKTAATGSIVYTAIYFDSNTTSGDWGEIDTIYIGDGSYTASTRVLDTSPSLLQLTPQTGVVRVDGPSGYAVDTTIGGLYSASESGLPMLDTARTLAIWVKSSAPGSSYRMIFEYGLQSTGACFYFYHNGSNFQIDKHGGAVLSIPDTGYLDGNWHLFVITYAGSSGAIIGYVDGVLKAQSTGVSYATAPGAGISLGYDPITSGRNFQGQLSRPQIWSRALSASEVLGLWAMPAPPNLLALNQAVIANAQLANIASDNVLSSGEKGAVILDNSNILAEQTGIDAQAAALSITTEKTAYDSAVSALTTYLATLTAPTLWSDVTGDTTIVGTTFRSTFASVYSTRQALLNKIAATIQANASAAATAAANAPALTPKYIAGGFTTLTNAPSPAANVGDWVLFTGTTGTYTKGTIYKWTGSAWTSDSDAGHAGWALFDIIALISAGGPAPTGWTYLANLISNAALINNLMSQYLKIVTGGSLRGGDRYNADGSLADGTKPGFFLPSTGLGKVAGLTFEGSLGGGVQWSSAQQIGTSFSVAGLGTVLIAAMTQSQVALIDSSTGVLKAYSWNGTTWALVGSGLTLFAGAMYQICALNSTDIAILDTWYNHLSTYRFNGSTWALVGSAFGVTWGGGCICALSATLVVQYDYANKYLKAYSWSGSAWTLLGSLSITAFFGFPGITALNGTDVALIDDAGATLTTYRWNGSTFAIVGAGLALTGLFGPRLSAINGTDVVQVDGGNKLLRMYRFNGATWAPVGTGIGVTISGSVAPSLTALNGTDVVYVDAINLQLRVYRFGFALAAPWQYPFT